MLYCKLIEEGGYESGYHFEGCQLITKNRPYSGEHIWHYRGKLKEAYESSEFIRECNINLNVTTAYYMAIWLIGEGD